MHKKYFFDKNKGQLKIYEIDDTHYCKTISLSLKNGSENFSDRKKNSAASIVFTETRLSEKPLLFFF